MQHEIRTASLVCLLTAILMCFNGVHAADPTTESTVTAYLGPDVGDDAEVIFRDGHEYGAVFPGDTLEKFFHCLCSNRSQTCTVKFGQAHAVDEDGKVYNHTVTDIEFENEAAEDGILKESATYKCGHLVDATIGAFDCVLKSTYESDGISQNSEDSAFADTCDFRCITITWPLPIELANFGWGTAERSTSHEFCYHSKFGDISSTPGYDTTQELSSSVSTEKTTLTTTSQETTSRSSTQETTSIYFAEKSSTSHLTQETSSINPLSTDNNNNSNNESKNMTDVQVDDNEEKPEPGSGDWNKINSQSPQNGSAGDSGIRTEILIVGIFLGISLLSNAVLIIFFCSSWVIQERKRQRESELSDQWTTALLFAGGSEAAHSQPAGSEVVVNPTYGDFERQASTSPGGEPSGEQGGTANGGQSFGNRVIDELKARDQDEPPKQTGIQWETNDAMQGSNGIFFVNNISELEDDTALYSTI